MNEPQNVPHMGGRLLDRIPKSHIPLPNLRPGSQYGAEPQITYLDMIPAFLPTYRTDLRPVSLDTHARTHTGGLLAHEV